MRWRLKFPKVVQAHTLGEVGNLGTFSLRVSFGTILPIFIEIGSYLTEKEQKISWHSFFETRCTLITLGVQVNLKTLFAKRVVNLRNNLENNIINFSSLLDFTWLSLYCCAVWPNTCIFNLSCSCYGVF